MLIAKSLRTGQCLPLSCRAENTALVHVLPLWGPGRGEGRAYTQRRPQNCKHCKLLRRISGRMLCNDSQDNLSTAIHGQTRSAEPTIRAEHCYLETNRSGAIDIVGPVTARTLEDSDMSFVVANAAARSKGPSIGMDCVVAKSCRICVSS